MTRTKLTPTSLTVGLALAAILFVSAQSPALAQGTLFVKSDKVGVGIGTPLVKMHVQVSDPLFPDIFRVQNVGGTFAGFRFATTSGNIDFNNANNKFRLNFDDADPWELELLPNGNLYLPQGTIFTQGSCAAGCDRVFAPDYELPSIEEHAEAMWSNRYLPTVGPTPEGQPINLTDKTERMLNELEKAHIYIDQLNGNLKEKDARIAGLEQRLNVIESLVTAQN